ncbi:MAG TPA: aminodeoxychorismate/anthranilate synthase component II [Bacteroidota bacterium]|nr:aminodeoxychorismate/anthranilate synthase component II [Bacteroidota bacterium]
MILVIDNFDSFTYNLVQTIGMFTTDIVVRRNNQMNVEEVAAMKPAGVVISPGPGRPEDAGITVELIRSLGPTLPTLGVCLGHQAIGFAFGANIVHAPSLMHGRTSTIRHNGDPLFVGVENPFEATRYHSLVIAKDGLPREIAVTAESEDGVIMGVRHRRYPVTGVQFHPESILTKQGTEIIGNWLKGAAGV